MSEFILSIESDGFIKNQYELAYPDGIEEHWWNLARNQIIERELSLIGHVEGVLEVGCGKGVVVKYLRSQKYNCIGVELASVTPLVGLEEFVFSGVAAESLPAELRSSIKVIMLLDVIEHIEDPGRFLEGLRASYPSLEKLLITVPARKELWSNYDDFYGHYRRYDRKMLVSLSERLGLRLETNRYFFHALYPLLLVFSLLKSKRPLTNTAPNGIMKYFHRMMARVLLFESRLLPSGLLGSSILAVYSNNDE